MALHVLAVNSLKLLPSPNLGSGFWVLGWLQPVDGSVVLDIFFNKHLYIFSFFFFFPLPFLPLAPPPLPPCQFNKHLIAVIELSPAYIQGWSSLTIQTSLCTPSQTCLQVSLLGDFRSSQVDSED